MPVFVDGHHLITPTSVAKTGTGSTATINTNGSVTFSSCATLSLNGVFSADYDNYMIVHRFSLSTLTAATIYLRKNGTNNTSSYTHQYLYGFGTSISPGRIPDWQNSYSTGNSGEVFWLYGPYINQPTAYRMISASGNSGAELVDRAGTHGVSDTFDGIHFSIPGTMTGLIAVYGAVK